MRLRFESSVCGAIVGAVLWDGPSLLTSLDIYIYIYTTYIWPVAILAQVYFAPGAFGLRLGLVGFECRDRSHLHQEPPFSLIAPHVSRTLEIFHRNQCEPKNPPFCTPRPQIGLKRAKSISWASGGFSRDQNGSVYRFVTIVNGPKNFAAAAPPVVLPPPKKSIHRWGGFATPGITFLSIPHYQNE